MPLMCADKDVPHLYRRETVSELRFTKSHPHNTTWWGRDNALICGRGLHRLTDVPRSAKAIVAVTSRRDTGVDCFEVTDNGNRDVYLAIRLVDHPRVDLDIDFAKWLRRRIAAGEKYLRIEYEV
jgi:hypothetical protein